MRDGEEEEEEEERKKERKKEEEEEQNWNFHIRFFQLWEGLMELWEYISH